MSTTISTSGSSRLDGHTQDADSRTPLLTKSLHMSATVSKRTALLFQNWWLCEILSAATAATAISGIIIILVIFDQSPLPDWPSIFTVGSICILTSNLLLKCCLDKLSHLLLCNSSDALHHFGCRSLDLTIKRVMVSSGRASPFKRPSTFR